VEYARWAPIYAEIAREFGFDWAAEEASAEALARRLPERARSDPLGELRRRLEGRDAVVVGLAPGLGAPPLARLPRLERPPTILAADGAAARCLAAGLVPDLIATDLDGPVPAEVTANIRGALVVVHAHGDNRPALERWVPEFPGPLAGSWAGPPRAELLDVGGFTDGDRAAYLAEAGGARRIWLFGFDFDRVDGTTDADPERKRAKLRWARIALERLAAESRTPMFWWRPDGTYVQLGAGPYGSSTQ
jgi:uncharacterized Rossmann fold enzyme